MSHAGQRPRCTATTQAGVPCRAFAPPGSTQCQVHDPARQERFKAACAKGARMKALNGQRRRLDTPAALLTFTSALVQDILAGTVQVDVGRTGLYGVGIQKSLLELQSATDFEQRLAALEQRLSVVQPGQRGGRRWTG